MAELAITTTLGVLQIVVPLLAKLNIGEKERPNIKIMESWLTSMKAFIQDYDGVEGGKTLEEHIKKVREIAYEIEDALDEIMLHTLPYSFHKHEISRTLHQKAHELKHKSLICRIPDKNDSINKRIEAIGKQLQAFPVGPAASSKAGPSSRIPHHVSPLLLDQDMVGYEVERNDLISLLEDGGQRLVRVAVVGPSGSGKTTLVKNVYWDRKIRTQFECHAWLHMGQRFNVTDLYRNLLKQLGLRSNSYPTDHDSCLTMLRNYVGKKRYLVVLDDIWGEMDRIWDYIKKAFPDAFEGSRIIVTTRFTDASTQQHIIRLNGLEQQQGWNLFCKKAFADNNGECPADLKHWATMICKRCEGQPLAIVAVGGALAQCKLPNQWETFHKNFHSESWKDSSNLKLILHALLPDYLALDSNLKSCFLYFSIFPEDYSIQRGRLIRLWVAEGFAMGNSSKTAEEVAEAYLNVLIQRNLVHVSDWGFDGRPRNCRVLNLVLKFIIQKCEDENFASIFNLENESQSQKVRRMSVHSDHNLNDLVKSDFSCLRSIFLSRLLGTSASDFNDNLCKMKLLRVFDLQAVPLTDFPKGITNLILIKHISFRGTKIKEIPSSIEKLSYLETLDLKETKVTELPKEISHLHKLRHLIAYNYCVYNYVVFDSVTGVKIHNGIDNLKNLQNLSLVKVDRKGKLLKELKKLKELRKLGLIELRTEHGKYLCAAVEEMKYLRTLDVCAITPEEYLELEEIKNGPSQTLQRLYLKGRLRKLPGWISSFGYLHRVALKWSKLQSSPLEGLGKLPNLLELQLVDCYLGEELIFPSPGFRKLEILVIEEMEKLHTIVIQDGAMPDLKELSLLKCSHLKMCPLGIEKLCKVEKLNLYDMDLELVGRLGKKGQDHAMVEHINMVSSYALNSNGSFDKIF